MSDEVKPKQTTHLRTVDRKRGARVGHALTNEGHPGDPETGRKLALNHTGFYEAEPTNGENSSCVLHLNQAGRALVGWFSPPPDFVPHPDFSIGPAVLVSHLDKPVQAGYQFYYLPCDKKSVNEIDPTAVIPPSIPWLLDNGPPKERGIGIGYIDLSVADRVKVTFVPRRDAPNAVVVLNRVHSNPRLSSRATKNQSPAMQRILRARQESPIPRSFFDISKPSGRVWKEALDLLSPNGKLAPHIRRYVKEATLSPFTTINVGIDIAVPRLRKQDVNEMIKARDDLSRLLHFPWDGSPQAEYLNARLLQQTLEDDKSRGLAIGSDVKSVLDWLGYIALYEKDALHHYGSDLKSGGELPENFIKVMACTVVYRYTLEIKSFMAPTPPELLSAALGFFGVDIAVHSAKRNSDGSIGEWGEVGSPAMLGGVFLEVKGGLNGPPELPKKVEFYSASLVKAQSFVNAIFRISSIEAGASTGVQFATPFFKVGPKLSIGGKTQIMQIYLQESSICLEGIYEDASVVPKLKELDSKGGMDWDRVKKMYDINGKEDMKKVAGLSLPKLPDSKKNVHSVFSVGISTGAGLFFSGAKVPDWVRPAPQIRETQVDATHAQTIAAVFEWDTYTFKRDVNGWPVKFLVEEVLATELAQFAGIPVIECVGFASPEGPAQRNRWLAASRANALLQLLEDAIGIFPVEYRRATCSGADDALSFLHDPDPPNDPKAAREFREKYSEKEKPVWPQWRKVELYVRGKVAVSVLTVDGAKKSAS